MENALPSHKNIFLKYTISIYILYINCKDTVYMQWWIVTEYIYSSTHLRYLYFSFHGTFYFYYISTYSTFYSTAFVTVSKLQLVNKSVDKRSYFMKNSSKLAPPQPTTTVKSCFYTVFIQK